MMSPAETPLRIVIIGVTGRTGSHIESLAQESPHYEVVAGISSTKDLQRGYPLYRNLDEAPEYDAVIDFSTPAITEDLALSASKRQGALIVGTTGISESGMKALQEASKKIPVLFSPNMSVGVNLLFALTGRTTQALGGQWDIEIAESHHRHKKDSPSGTAVRLAQEAEKGLEEASWVHGREGLVGARKSNEIGIHAMRGGDIVGEHTVFFIAEGERIELTHRATDRRIFARGALLAASWTSKKQAGFYSMNDVLGIE